MFDKLHLLSQDVPEGGDGFRWKAHPYLRIAGTVPKGPAVFDWSARQRADIEALWRDPTADGARERLAKDLAAFCERLGWTPEPKVLEDAEKAGEEYMVTLSAAAPELYILPWEVVQIGAEGQYLSDYASAQVRYAMPGLDAREVPPKPELPGVLFAWSGAGGDVPHDEQAAAIRAAAEAGGVAFRELADVDEVSLQAALDAGALSVLHLLCHGLPGPDGEPSRLSWGAVDNPSEITATRLARLVRRYDSAIRMVVLSTCGGGDGYDNPMLLGSVAQELHKKGIRSVVASRYPLSVCGSSVMTRSLYDKLLRDAWSLERSLRYTREALLRVADHGETHPGDAYGIQLYAYDMERFVSDNEVEAERPVLATYPFGTAEHPVPAHGPPVTELTLTMENEPKLTEDELVAKLRRVAEDEHLTVAIPLDAKPGDCKLHVHTTMDGAQRLLGAWRSKILHVVIGVAIGKLVLAKGLGQILQTIASTVVGKASAGTLAASIGAAGGSVGTAAGGVGAAAGNIGAAAGGVGAAAGKGGATVGSAAGKIGMGAARAGTPTSQVGSAAKVGSAVGKASAAAGKAGAAVGQTAASGGQAAVVGHVGVAAGHAGASAAGAAGGAGGAGLGAGGAGLGAGGAGLGAGGAGLGVAGGAGGAGLGAASGAGGAGLGVAGGAGGAGLGVAGGAGGAGLAAAGGAGAGAIGAVGAGAGLGTAGAAGGAGLVAGGAGGAGLVAGGAGGAGLVAGGAGLVAGGAGGAGLGAAGAGKLAAVLALVGNAVSAKVVVALVGTAALAGGVAMYRAETRPPRATGEAAAAADAAAPGSAKSSDPARRGARARGTASPASAATVVEPTASPDMVAGAPSAIGGGPSATAGGTTGGSTGTGQAAAAMRSAPAGSVAGGSATAQIPSTTTGKPAGSAGGRVQDGAAAASAGHTAGTADGGVAAAPGPAGATGGAAGTTGEAVAAAPGPAGATGGSANTDGPAMPGAPARSADGPTGAVGSAQAGAMGESAGGSTRPVPAAGEAGAAAGPTGAGAAAANGSESAAAGSAAASAAGSPPRAGEPPAPAAEAKAERPTPPGQVAATGARVAPASGSAAAPSPSEAAAAHPSEPSAAADAKPAAAVCGNGTKEVGEQCDDGNTRDGDGCSAKCRFEPVAIAPSALELERVSGNTDIHPSKQTRSQMIAAGVNSVTGVVRLCVDTAGAVTEAELQDATGYAEYDRKLVAAVRDWRFHPFVIHGTAMAVCSTTEFVYAPK